MYPAHRSRAISSATYPNFLRPFGEMRVDGDLLRVRYFTHSSEHFGTARIRRMRRQRQMDTTIARAMMSFTLSLKRSSAFQDQSVIGAYSPRSAKP